MNGLIIAHLRCKWTNDIMNAVRCVMRGHHLTQVLAQESIICATRVYFEVFGAHLPTIMVSIVAFQITRELPEGKTESVSVQSVAGLASRIF